MDLSREWTAFGGASLALMGTALCAGARRHAEDALAWQRLSRTPAPPGPGSDDGSSLILVYRIGGAIVILLGAALAAAAIAGRATTSTRFGPSDGPALGACFALLGAAFAALKLRRTAARGPRFLAGEPLASGPERRPGERVAAAATWSLCALWIWFGLRLIAASR